MGIKQLEYLEVDLVEGLLLLILHETEVDELEVCDEAQVCANDDEVELELRLIELSIEVDEVDLDIDIDDVVEVEVEVIEDLIAMDEVLLLPLVEVVVDDGLLIELVEL